MATIEDLGKLKKQQYPGQYDDLTDLDLGYRIKEANPGKYDDYAVEESQSKAKPRSAVSKTIETAGKVLGFTGDLTAKKVIAPIAKSLSNNAEVKARLDALMASKDQKFGSDVGEAILPGMFSHVPGEPFALSVGKTISRIGVDALTDPLSYLEIGNVTKLGRLREIAAAEKAAGNPIKLGSDLAKGIAKEEGSKAVSPQSIKNFLKTAPGTNLEQQVKGGERAIASFGVGDARLNLTGDLPSKIVAPLSALRKADKVRKIDMAVRDLFSTQSGIKDFDVVLDKYRNATLHRAHETIEDAKVFNTQIDDLSRELATPRDVLVRQMDSIIEKVSQPTKAMNIQTYGKVVHKALEEHYTDKLVDAKVALKNAQMSGANPDAIDQLSKKVADYNSTLNEHMGKYAPATGIDPQVEALARDASFKLENQRLAEEAAGLPARQLLADRGYLPRITTEQTNKSLRAKAIAEGTIPPKLSTKEFSEHVANYLHRQFNEVKPLVIDGWAEVGLITKREAQTIKGKNGLDKLEKMLQEERISPSQYTNAVHSLGIPDIEALPRSVKEKIFGKDVGDEVFHVDPVYSTTIRTLRGQRAIGAAEFINEIKNRGLVLPAGKSPADYVPLKQAELKGFKAPPEIARVLNKFNEFNINPSELAKAWNTYDKFHSLTKAWTLAIFPAYHSKNMVGNFWNNWLAGLNNPSRYAEALQVQLGKKLGFTDVLGNKWTSESLKEEASKLGVIRRGQYAADPHTTIKQALETFSKNPLNPSSKNMFLRAGRTVGSQIEDNARLAHFIDRIKKGDTTEQAALSVKKFLFDYGDLTEFERKVMNRGLFFYKWTKENLPLQLHSLVTTPWKFGMPFKAKYEIEKNVPEAKEKYLAEWMKENFPTRIRYNKDKGTSEYFMLNSWLPAADLLKFAHLHEVAAQMLAPIPKEMMQQMFNYDYYFKNKIQTIPGEKTKFLGQDLPVRLVHGMKVIRALNEVDKLTKEDSDLYTKMIGILAGKNYTFDPRTAVVANKARVDNDMDDLRSALMNAQRNHNQTEARRIVALMREKAREY